MHATILRIKLCALLIVCSGVTLSELACAQTPTLALYYTSHGKLLQAEDLTAKTNFGDRMLQDISHLPVPRITLKSVNNMPEKCQQVSKRPMRSSADFVIYWGKPASMDNLVHPLYVEYVRDVKPADREMENCYHFETEDQGCAAGKRCATGCAGAATNTCASYCCVPYP